MKEHLLIKYSFELKDSGGFDLGLLGESFAGFSSLLKDLITLSELQGDVEIKTSRISEGSIEVYNVIQVASTIPFHDIRYLLEFLQVADLEKYKIAYDFFNSIQGAHRGINDYFARNPFDTAVVAGLLAVYLPRMIDWAAKQKNRAATKDIWDEKISERYAKGLKQMVVGGKFKRALKPLTENSVSTVDVVALDYRVVATIDEQKLGNYLPDEEKILPELKNGMVRTFNGEIVALQSTKGETLKVRIADFDPRFSLLVAHPSDGKQTENYKDFYKKQVEIEAEIYRKTEFRRPELVIRDVQLLQRELFDGEQ